MTSKAIQFLATVYAGIILGRALLYMDKHPRPANDRVRHVLEVTIVAAFGLAVLGIFVTSLRVIFSPRP
jgi:hypothetical protein